MTVLLEVRALVKEFPVASPRDPVRPGGRRGRPAIAGGRLRSASSANRAPGKTTVARCVLGLTPPTAGSIAYDGVDARRGERAPTARECSSSSSSRSRRSTRG